MQSEIAKSLGKGAKSVTLRNSKIILIDNKHELIDGCNTSAQNCATVRNPDSLCQ